jgi:Flp pilus assembly pilin Flp
MAFNTKRKQRGQGMTEYIIIVALIAIAAIAVYQLFGNTVRNQTAAIAQELAGNDGTTSKDNAQAAAAKAEDVASTKRDLDNFTGNKGKGKE